jgi:hypothetical protein
MPDFDSDTFKMAFNPLVTEENTLESIIRKARDAWSEDHQARLVNWQRQQEEDEEAARHLAEEQEREEREIRRAQEEAARLEKLEKEKKKPKVKAFVTDKPVGTVSAPRVSPYAQAKVRALDYVEVHYFTDEGRAEAKYQDRTTSDATMALTQEDGKVFLTPAAAHKPSTKVVPDEQLTWRQMSIGKTGLLQVMKKEGWPQEHVIALAQFFLEIDSHRLRSEPNGEEALLLYAAEVRREWHEQLKSTDEDVQPFDISVINEERLRNIYDTLLSRKKAKSIERLVPILHRRGEQQLTSVFLLYLSAPHGFVPPHPSLLHHRICFTCITNTCGCRAPLHHQHGWVFRRHVTLLRPAPRIARCIGLCPPHTCHTCRVA